MNGIRFTHDCGVLEPPFSRTNVTQEIDGKKSLQDLEALFAEKLAAPLFPMQCAKDWEFATRTMVETPLFFDNDIREQLQSFIFRLFRTNPREAFPNLWNNKRLSSTSVTNAWAGVYNTLGCGWSPRATTFIQEVMNGGDVPPVIIDDPSIDAISVQPTQEETIDTTLESATPLNEKQMEHQPIAKRPRTQTPTSILKSTGTDGSQKSSTTVQWLDKPDNTTRKDQGIKPAPLKEKKKGFNLFVYKPKKPREKKSASLTSVLHGKKFVTFLKLNITKSWKNAHGTQASENEVCETFASAVNTIFKIDKEALILPWAVQSKVKPINSKRFQGIPSKNAAGLHCDNLFVRQNSPSWIRLKIAHNSDISIWREQEAYDLFKQQDMFMGVDRLQAQRITCAGWLLGSHQSMDARALEECMQLHPKLKQLKVEVRWQVIKLRRREQVDPNNMVRAYHIWTDKDTVKTMRSVLNEVYGRTNKGAYPGGRVMRFVPHVADPEMLTTFAIERNASRCLSKQRVFQERTTTIMTSIIEGLDYCPPSLDLSLREACMKIKRPDKDNSVSLFISIDEVYGGNTSFLVKKEMERQAKSIINTLPVILEAQFGPAVYDWFVDGTQANMTGFYWDSEGRCVKSSHDPDEDLLDWEHDGEWLSGEALEQEEHMMIEDFKIVIDNDHPLNQQQFTSGASIATFGSVCRDSLASAGSSPLPSVTDSDLQRAAASGKWSSSARSSNPSFEDVAGINKTAVSPDEILGKSYHRPVDSIGPSTAPTLSTSTITHESEQNQRTILEKALENSSDELVDLLWQRVQQRVNNTTFNTIGVDSPSPQPGSRSTATEVSPDSMQMATHADVGGTSL